MEDMSGDFRKSLEIAKICQNNIPAKNKPQKTNTTPPPQKKLHKKPTNNKQNIHSKHGASMILLEYHMHMSIKHQTI